MSSLYDLAQYSCYAPGYLTERQLLRISAVLFFFPSSCWLPGRVELLPKLEDKLLQYQHTEKLIDEIIQVTTDRSSSSSAF
jgi:hypothetical protein